MSQLKKTKKGRRKHVDNKKTKKREGENESQRGKFMGNASPNS